MGRGPVRLPWMGLGGRADSQHCPVLKRDDGAEESLMITQRPSRAQIPEACACQGGFEGLKGCVEVL